MLMRLQNSRCQCAQSVPVAEGLPGPDWFKGGWVMEGTAWLPFVSKWGTSAIWGKPTGSTCDPAVCRWTVILKKKQFIEQKKLLNFCFYFLFLLPKVKMIYRFLSTYCFPAINILLSHCQITAFSV